jgi:choline-glycine betaine transporter
MTARNDTRAHETSARGPAAFSDSDPVVLVLTIGFIFLFVGASIADSEWVAEVIGAGFGLTAKYLGSFFQLLLLLTFFIALGTAATRAGAARIGGLDRPEISRFRWLSMIMCTLLAGGGVFFDAGEPVRGWAWLARAGPLAEAAP